MGENETNTIGIVDEPNPKGSYDTLNISKHADALTEFIKYSSTPMTIGIQGEWGSGKTSLLNSIYHSLSQEGIYKQIWINSWEHSLLSTPAESLLKIINEIIQEMLLSDKKITHKEQITELASTLFKGALRVGATAIGGSEAGAVTKELLGDNVNSIKQLREQLEKLAQAIKDSDSNIDENKIHTNYEKIIIYVDDLDRIEPKDAVSILELLKNIFSIPNCIFVLAIDYQVIVKGLKEKFGDRTEENEWEFRAFFDKIIQLPFMMPMGQYDIGNYISGLLKQIGFIDHGDEFGEKFTEIISYTIGGNPRSLKRLVNSLTLINIFSKIDNDNDDETVSGEGDVISEDDDINDLLLFSLVCLQISFPKIYDVLVENPDFSKWGDDTAFKVTKKKEEDEIEKFEKDFEIAKATEDFDEDWEISLFRMCYTTPRYRSRVGEISKFFSYLKDDLLKDKKDNELKSYISEVIEMTSVTSVSTSDDSQIKASRPFQRTLYTGYDEWEIIQIDEKLGRKETKSDRLTTLKTIKFLHDSILMAFEGKDGFEMKYSKTGGCTGYAKKRKFLSIDWDKKGRCFISILKDYKKEYRLPNIPNFTTAHIRRTYVFCEQFQIRANSFEIFNTNITILLDLINRSYELATIYKNKILKEKDLKDNIISLDKYLDPEYRYDYEKN